MEQTMTKIHQAAQFETSTLVFLCVLSIFLTIVGVIAVYLGSRKLGKEV